MRMPELEKFLVNSPVRILFQRLVPTPFFLKYSRLQPRSCCLEVGCGQGAGAEIIVKAFKTRRIIAQDYDLAQVQLAQRRIQPHHHRYLYLLAGDVASLSFAPARFEAVFDYAILHHVPSWPQALAEIYRVLKPRGQFFYEELLQPLLKKYLFAKLFPHPPQAHFSQQEFEQTLTQLGFDLCSSRRWGKGYLLGVAQKP